MTLFEQKSTEINKCNGNTLPNCVPDKILPPHFHSPLIMTGPSPLPPLARLSFLHLCGAPELLVGGAPQWGQELGQSG